MDRPVLSVLMATVPKREGMARLLYSRLEEQAQCGQGSVEVLMLLDNRRRTIGAKRQALLDIARGEYIAYVDDDDDVDDLYVREILKAIFVEHIARGTPKPDVVVFPIRVTIDGGQDGVVEPSLAHVPREGEPLAEYRPPVTKRPPHELCVWRAEVARMGRFPDTSADEDFKWAAQVWPHATRETRIDRVLYWWKSQSALWEAGHQ